GGRGGERNGFPDDAPFPLPFFPSRPQADGRNCPKGLPASKRAVEIPERPRSPRTERTTRGRAPARGRTSRRRPGPRPFAHEAKTMAHDSAGDTLSSDDLDRALEAEPADELLGDQLIGTAADVPIVEPRLDPAPLPRNETRGLVRALWFFGIVITALFVLQTVQLFL